MKNNAVSLKAARAAKQHAVDLLNSILDEEVAIGITRIDDQGFALKINLDNAPDADVQLPQHVDGVPIQYEIVGKIRKLGG